ncbi:MAG: ABC-F family ATP-binding cassette domain-containing protein [Meiothermus sp.]|uniref:ribosomal protection-like ABC-F family protein n=1 Tax=Meiothermus sp. TaxID=1955249 RepID=UPI0025DD942A|nr:ABC-F family ATP-binding cassette domain-containing protein [Meiothermus sp.]MCS7058127.1 ABC-F family ATP-binding cassette domain-containing protein [Meiothermus sp.]MCS7194350.1 ABC-F family ATP-binding cassette domain-containing protein [Meiothermus sp.]MCX7739913.1 ABC-F family ATP-binding cassette domain-containing protein [Meiothermus sp.]MDW8089831.1 ABC-F family ATP-binding cassette domain-containing protein [Meiothermus sp.]MDW8481742.1 ABC-F family ATP-binding cassette domain-cont
MRIVLAENLELTLGGRELLRGVRLELRRQDRLALVGANGSGKTSLLRLLAGELEPTGGRIHRTEGVHLELLPQDPQYGPDDTVKRVLERGFARIQAMEAELARLEAHLADPVAYQRWEALQERYQAVGGYQQRARYEAVLKGLRFEGREGEKASLLSGGEARRLALGALLLSGADALLMDEPTNHLDLEMVEWLVDFLQSYGGAVVVVSHDRRFLDRVTERVAWLRRGRLRLYEGNYTAFRKQRALQEAQEAREHGSWLKEKERLEGILEQAQRWAHSSAKHARRLHSLEARMDRLMQEAVEAPELDEAVQMRFPLEKPATAERVLEGWELQKNLGGRRLFHIPHLLVRRGERIALIGPNGAGKTTLLRVLLGLLPSDHPAGRVRVGPGVRIGYYDQKLSGFNPELTLYETLYRMLGEGAHAALGAWMFPYEAQFKQVRQLSGGERARLALLSLSLQQASLLVLDEPTNHLDLETVEALEGALLGYPGTLLLVSHDLAFLDGLATRTWHLSGGQFADYPGPPGEYLGRRKAEVGPRQPEYPRSRAETQNPKPPRAKGRWHLEREKEQLEAEIARLEAQVQAVLAKANQPGLHHSEYAQIAQEQIRLEAALEQAYNRWTEVAERLEGLA